MWNIRKKYSHVPDQMFCLPASVFVCFAPVALPLHRIWRYYTSTILPLDDNHVWCRKSHTGKMLTSGCGLWWCHLCVFPTPQHIGLQLTQSQPCQPCQRLPLKPTLLFFILFLVYFRFFGRVQGLPWDVFGFSLFLLRSEVFCGCGPHPSIVWIRMNTFRQTKGRNRA